MSRPSQGLGAGDTPDDYDEYLRNKYGGSQPNPSAANPSSQQQARPRSQMPTMPRMPEMPKWDRGASSGFSGFGGPRSGPSFPQQNQPGVSSFPRQQPPESLSPNYSQTQSPQSSPFRQSGSQSFEPASYGLSGSRPGSQSFDPAGYGLSSSRPGSQSFDPAGYGLSSPTHSQAGSAQGRNTPFEASGYSLSPRSQPNGSGYHPNEPVQPSASRRPDLSGYGLGPATPPQQPASPERSEPTQPASPEPGMSSYQQEGARAYQQQPEYGSSSSQQQPEYSTSAYQQQPDQAYGTSAPEQQQDPYQQSILSQINPSPNAGASSGNPFASESSNQPTDFEQSVMAPTTPLDNTPSHVISPRDRAFIQQQPRTTAAGSSQPLSEPVEPTCELLSGDAALRRSTYNDDAASTAVQPSEASFDGSAESAQPALLQGRTPASDSPASGSRVSTPAAGRTDPGYESARGPRSAINESGSTDGGMSHTADERLPSDRESPCEQIPSYEQAPSRDEGEQDGLPTAAAGASSDQPAVTDQVQAHLQKLLGGLAAKPSAEGAQGDREAFDQGSHTSADQGTGFVSPPLPGSSSTAKPSDTPTDTSAIQSDAPPSKYAEALAPLAVGGTGGTSGGDSGNTYSGSASGGIGATVAQKASQLYNSLPGGTQHSAAREGGVSQQETGPQPGTAHPVDRSGQETAPETASEQDAPASPSSGGITGLGSSTLAAIGSKFGVTLNKTPGVTSPRAEDEGPVEGLKPSRGYPGDEAPAEAAVGGNAAALAPAAAAVAAGGSESDAADKEASPYQSTGLVGTAAAALSSAGDTASALQSKYAPAALGGTGADSSYSGTSRTGAGLGADPYPGDVEGLQPAKGTPSDAPADEAATGGNAGRIAGIAAGVASGKNEDTAARSMLQDESAPASSATPADDPSASPSSGGIVGLGSSAVAAIGSKFGVTLSKTPGATSPRSPQEQATEGRDKGLSPKSSYPGKDVSAADATTASPGAFDKDPAATGSPQGAGIVDRAAAALAAAGGTAGALQSKYAPTALGGTPSEDPTLAPSAGAGAEVHPGNVQGLQPAQGTPSDAPASEAARGANAGSIAGIAAGVAAGQSEESAAKELPQARAARGSTHDTAPATADSAGLPSTTPTEEPASSGLLGKTLGIGSAAAAAVGDSFSNAFSKAPGTSSATGPEEEGLSPKRGYPGDAAPSEAAKGGKAASLAPEVADKAASSLQDPASASAGPAGRRLTPADSVDEKFGGLAFGGAPAPTGHRDQPDRAQQPGAQEGISGGGSSSGIGTPETVTGPSDADSSTSRAPAYSSEDAPSKPAAGGILGLGAAAGAAAADKIGETFSRMPGLSGTGNTEEGYTPKQGFPRDAAPTDAAVGGSAAALAPAVADRAAQDPALAQPSTLSQASEKITDAASSLTRKYAPKSLGGVDASYDGPNRTGAGLGADPSSQGDIQGLSPKHGYPLDAPASQAPLGGLGAGIASVAAAVATGGSEKAAVKQWKQEGEKLSPDDVESLVAAAGADDDSLRALADSTSSGKQLAPAGTSDEGMGAADKTRGLEGPASAAEQPEAATFADQANAALGAAQDKLHDMGFVTRPGPHSGSKGPVLGGRTVSAASARLENRQQNSPVIVAGVALVLVSLFVKVPLWMWLALLSITGLLYVAVHFVSSQKPKPE